MCRTGRTWNALMLFLWMSWRRGIDRETFCSTSGTELALSKITSRAVLGDASLLRLRLTQGGTVATMPEVVPKQTAVSLQILL